MGEAYKVFLQMRETGYLVTKKKKLPHISPI